MSWKRTADRRSIGGSAGVALVAIALVAGPGPGAESVSGSGAVESSDEALRVGIVADTSPAGVAFAEGAKRAAAEWNAAHRARRLELFTLRPARPWLDGTASLARLVFTRDLAALAGSPDAATAHAAAQIATVKRIPFITVSPEDGLTRVFDPWIFRSVPADGEQARAVLNWAFRNPAGHRVTLFVPPGRAGRERSAALEEACNELGVTVVSRVEVTNDGAGDIVAVGAATEAVLLWLDSAPAREILEQLRRLGFDGPVLGSTRLDDPAFRIMAEGVALPQFATEQPEGSHALDPQGYDVVRALALAAEPSASPDDIRRALADGSSATSLRFDSHGNRVVEIHVGVVRDGIVHPAPAFGGSS